jgi:two-component system sensor histidine kinase KdpD
VGVIGLHRAKLLTTEERRLLDSLNDQTALAIERALLAERVDEARVLVEADKLRVAMLSSLSHDLKTPLASILGAATTLAANLDLYDVERTKEILTTVREEAERLDRFVGNLLDMSRLEAGVLGAKPEPVDIADILAAATVRLRTLLSGHRLSEKIALDLPFARVDPLLLEQALVNVLDNAAKYSPTNSRIWLKAAPDKDIIVLTIEDEGPGIPPVDLAHVFDKFHRIRKADRVAGTGLGLSVARGFVESFGGTLTAANRDGKAGAIFTFRLPVEPEAKG